MGGLSICIPCYVFDPAPLLDALLAECAALGYPPDWEIIVCDDGSPHPISIDQTHVRLLRNVPNLGRVGTRQRLAKEARFQHLLFVDADSLPVYPQFLQIYYRLCQAGTLAAAGGTAYQPTCPTGPGRHLRWHYGHAREVRAPQVRQAMGNRGLAANNLFINRALFLSIDLPHLPTYGHEDTLLGYKLALKGITIAQVDNPVFHTGLEADSVFLNKALEGARTLASLPQASLPANHVRLSAAYGRLQRWHLQGVLWWARPLQPLLRVWVLRQWPGFLNAMDAIKLIEYAKYAHEKGAVSGDRSQYKRPV